jgi:hypothetical protein
MGIFMEYVKEIAIKIRNLCYVAERSMDINDIQEIQEEADKILEYAKGMLLLWNTQETIRERLIKNIEGEDNGNQEIRDR